VTLGIMSKNNEIVAIKASGISMYRLAVPLLLAGLALAVTMIVLDDTYLPYANQRQDALHNLIKGRPPQTYTHPQRWIFGEGSKIYNYDLFDPTQNLFAGSRCWRSIRPRFRCGAVSLRRARGGRRRKSVGSRRELGARFCRWRDCPVRAASAGHLAAGAHRTPVIST